MAFMYSVHSFCPWCGEAHDVGGTHTTEQEIGGDSTRLRNAFEVEGHGSVPDQLSGFWVSAKGTAYANTNMVCPQTNESFTIGINDDLFLVQLASAS